MRRRGAGNRKKYPVLAAAVVLLIACFSACGNAEETGASGTEEVREGAAESPAPESSAVSETPSEATEPKTPSEAAENTPTETGSPTAEPGTSDAPEEDGAEGTGTAETPAPSEVTPTESAPPTEEEIKTFLDAHYGELEHDMTLYTWESADATPFKILSGIAWQSQDERVAVVKDGVIHALAPGKALLTATAGGYSLFCNVEVISYDGMMLAVNCSKTIPLNESAGEVRLESEHPEIIEISGQQLTAKAMGSCRITAYMGESSSAFNVTVTDPQLSETALTKIMGTTEQLYVYGTPSKVVWKSDNIAIATVDENGLVTAASGGMNQMTTIRAQVDGTELTCQVTVDAIPQLSTSYRIYGYYEDTDESGAVVEHEISLYANANEVRKDDNKESVISMSSVKFYKDTYPVYYAYANETVNQGTIAGGKGSHTQLYLLGTSQDAHVMVKRGDNGEVSNGTTVTYTPMDGFGVIDVYIAPSLLTMEGKIETDYTGKETVKLYVKGAYSPVYGYVNDFTLAEGAVFSYKYDSGNRTFKIVSYELGEPESVVLSGQPGVRRTFTGTVLMQEYYGKDGVKVYVEVGGLTYQIYIDTWKLGVYNPAIAIPSTFYIDDDSLNADRYTTEAGSSSGQVIPAGSNSGFKNNSDSFVPGEWFEKMKGKFIEEAENQAVKWAVGLLFKLIFF